MIKKKIVLLGTYAVGKTSLVRSFVHSIFDDRYLSTIGVKIEQKDITINNKLLRLLIWDIHGEDEYQKIQNTFLMGASGFLLVADITRSSTLSMIFELLDRFKGIHGNVPFLLLLNKSDLSEMYEITEEMIQRLKEHNIEWIYTSAKTGEGVENAFLHISKKMIENDENSA